MTHPFDPVDWETEFTAESGFSAFDPTTGEPLPGIFPEDDAAVIGQRIEEASRQFIQFATSAVSSRATLLRRIAQELERDRARILLRAGQETALPEARLNGEMSRTTAQLNFFARLLEEGGWQRVAVDPADPEREPLPKPDLRLHYLGIGPVAVFGASNFPLAFSVAGGDTASALAAGCPVVVRAHPAHPGTSALTAAAIERALQLCELPAGLFSLIQGSGHEQGKQLVTHPAIKAVGFTGSLAGGRALFDLAMSRPEPIPFFGELGSINPVFLLPHALERDPEGLADSYIQSLTLGAGQFCTNPGVLLAVEGPALNRFLAQASATLEQSQVGTLLTAGIAHQYRAQTQRLLTQPEIRRCASGQSVEEPASGNQVSPLLLQITAEDWLQLADAHEEVFGPCGLVVTCRDTRQMTQIASRLQGQLTATLHCSDQDLDLAYPLLQQLQFKAGRVLFNGWPTGVEVSTAMVHGGPYPASTASQSTSVGARAIERFLRPVCLQNAPDALLPDALTS